MHVVGLKGPSVKCPRDLRLTRMCTLITRKSKGRYEWKVSEMTSFGDLLDRREYREKVTAKEAHNKSQRLINELLKNILKACFKDFREFFFLSHCSRDQSDIDYKDTLVSMLEHRTRELVWLDDKRLQGEIDFRT